MEGCPELHEQLLDELVEHELPLNGCIHDWVYSYVSATEFKIVSGTHAC